MSTDMALRRSLGPVERDQHGHVVVEPRTIAGGGLVASYGARVQPVLERMLSRGYVTQRQHDAGARLYASHALGIAGARNHDAAGCSSWSPAGYSDARLAATGDFRRAEQVLGRRLFPLVYAVCVEDQSVDGWCRANTIDRRGGMALLRLGLDTLGDEFGL